MTNNKSVCMVCGDFYTIEKRRSLPGVCYKCYKDEEEERARIAKQYLQDADGWRTKKETLYNQEQIQDSITGYLWYDAPWAIIRAVYPFISGYKLLDIGSGSGIMHKVFQILREAEGKDKLLCKGYNEDIVTKKTPFLQNDFHTSFSSHVIEHLNNDFPNNEYQKRFIDMSMQLARHRIIHVVPDGDVQDKNLGTPHLHVFNRQNFLELFKWAEDSGRLKRIHYGPIKGDRMDSLMYVGEVVK